VTNVRKVDELVAEIATASKEQNDGITQVNTAVTQMDKVTQSNAASAEESASAAQELNAQTHVLRGIVGDLLKLVGGTNEMKSVGVAPPPSKQAVASAPRKPAVAPAEKASQNGNGRKSPSAVISMAASDTRKKSELPMEGDFTSF